MRTAPRKPTDLIANASPWSCMHVDASIGVGPMSGRHRPTWRQRAAFRWLLEFGKNFKSTLKPDSFFRNSHPFSNFPRLVRPLLADTRDLAPAAGTIPDPCRGVKAVCVKRDEIPCSLCPRCWVARPKARHHPPRSRSPRQLLPWVRRVCQLLPVLLRSPPDPPLHSISLLLPPGLRPMPPVAR